MLKELYTAAMGMMPQQTRLEITSNNIANANTTGYKRIGIFEQNLIEARNNLQHIKGDAEPGDAPLSQYTDFNLGTLQKTENPLDLALDQDGFFVVHDDNGEEYFTRGGHFTLSQDGKLVATDGKFLAGENGGPIVIQQQADNALHNAETAVEIKIHDTGEVFANNQLVGRIAVVKVDNPQTLERVNGAEFLPGEDTNFERISAENIRLKQGYIESSNVNIINEMVQMIGLQRAFEIGQKVITTNDGTLDRSIEMGRFA